MRSARDDEINWTHYDFRAMRRQFKGFPPRLAIYEVYYTNREPVSWSQSPVTVTGKSVEELRAVLQSMMDALDRPVLSWEEAE